MFLPGPLMSPFLLPTLSPTGYHGQEMMDWEGQPQGRSPVPSAHSFWQRGALSRVWSPPPSRRHGQREAQNLRPPSPDPQLPETRSLRSTHFPWDSEHPPPPPLPSTHGSRGTDSHPSRGLSGPKERLTLFLLFAHRRRTNALCAQRFDVTTW